MAFNGTLMAPGRTCEVDVFCNEGQLDKALAALLGNDQQQCNVPSVHTYKSLLQMCMRTKGLTEARQIHTHLAKHGLESNKFLADFLVTALVSCGSLADGLQLFQRLPHRTVYSWTSIIAGYIDAGQYHEALLCHERMQQEGIQPDKYTFVSLLKACSFLEDLEEGKRIHAAALRHGFGSDVFICSILISMYAKCGSILDAQQVFGSLSHHNVVSWTAMITAFAQHDQGENALQIYAQMQISGVIPNSRTFVSVLQACGIIAEKEEGTAVDGRNVKLDSLRRAKQVHGEVVRSGFATDLFVGSTLVSMYAKCGSIGDARKVFSSLSSRNVVSWTAMIAAYAQQDEGDKALQIYGEMLAEGVSPNAWTFVSALQACASLEEREESLCCKGLQVLSLQKGKQVHAEAAERGFESGVFVGNALVSMYAKCGSIMDAQQVFERLSRRDVVSWNALIAAYTQQGEGEKALQVYRQVREDCVIPNARTFVAALQACCILADNEESALVHGHKLKVESLLKGKEIHGEASKWGFECDVFVASTLVLMYAKCGSIMDAQQVFDSLSVKDAILSRAMIAAYAQQGEGEKALQVFRQSQQQNFNLNESTFLYVLQACSNTGALDACLHTHRSLMNSGLGRSLSVMTSLIHAYGKCGSMVSAQSVFDSLSQPDVVSWTALMAGYARQGDCNMTLKCYDDMLLAGVKPDKVTFLALLSACSHAGTVDKGLEYFESMIRDHGIPADMEHYVCVIDLVGRAGLLSKAEDLLLQMPMQPTLPVWLSLLGACQKHSNVELGRRAFDGAVTIQPAQASAYLLMSNIYAHAGMWDCAKDIDEMRERAGAWKTAGQSWIEHMHEVHCFMVDDHMHHEEYELVKELSSKLKDAGHDAAYPTHTELCV